MKRLVPCIAITMALTGCKTLISADLFTSDLVATTEGEHFTAPLVIAIKAGSKSDCSEKAQTATQAIRTQFAEAEFIGCQEVDYSTFARIRIQANILDLTKTPQTPEKAYAIGVAKDGTNYQISFLANHTAIRAIWDALPEDMTKYKTYEFEPELSAVLNNDLRGDVQIITDDVFADSVPVQGTASHILTRRGQVEITLSNVSNMAFGSGANASQIVTFGEPD